jgi:hypothetical protein
MNNKTASEILKSLAMGQQPESGEDIENIDVLSDPNIIIAPLADPKDSSAISRKIS